MKIRLRVVAVLEEMIQSRLVKFYDNISLYLIKTNFY